MSVSADNSNTQDQKQTNANSAGTRTGNYSQTPSFGIFSRVAGLGSGGEVFEKLFDAIQKKIKYINEELNTDEKYAVIKLLKQNAGLNYSAIIVAETINDITAAHILMIEKTGDYPDRYTENIGGMRYDMLRTPADALDEKYVSQAQQAVADALRVELSTVAIVDGTLVPNEFDVTSESLVSELINNTFNATHSEINIRVNDYKGFNINNLLSQNRNGKFMVNMYFNPEDANFFDQTGMPIRQDVCIALSFKVNSNQNNKSVNQGNDTYEIVKTYGYIDFEWQPRPMANMMMTSQKFVPNFVITHVQSTVAPTPDILMLGVASVLAINEDMNWMQAFRPMPARKNQVDFCDIGALNVEGNIENNPAGFGKRYDTKAKTFTVRELNDFIQRLVHPNFMISIDIPKAGPETWFTSVLQYIKFRNSKEAYTRINEYMETLTNGNYQPGNVPMFAEVTNKIHGGYYKSHDGIKDIRHLNSYLSVANFITDTNQAPALIAQFTNTLYNSGMPAEIRAAERKKYIDEMSNNTAVYKQFYDRVTFSAVSLMNIVNSLKMVGFNPVFSNMGATNDMFQRRSTTDFGGAMLGNEARILGATNLYGSFYGMAQQYNRGF